ncbi:exosortase/archaeosortase family protein, partial [bacterium]
MIKAETAGVAGRRPVAATESAPGVDWRGVVAHPGFPKAVGLAVLVLFLFWSLATGLPALWFAPESSISQGPLIPVIAGYIFLTRWEKIKEMPAKGSWVALIFLVPLLYFIYIATRTQMMFTLSLGLIATIGLTVWLTSGLRIALATAPAILYLLFGLPVWQQIIDKFTQPMQEISAEASYAMLRGMGYQIFRPDSTTVMMDRFEFVVGAPCSGLKTMIALVAFTVLFILIARLQWWANALLAVFIIPFAILINA